MNTHPHSVNTRSLTTAVTVLSLAFAPVGCGDTNAPVTSGTFYGPVIPVANGSARSYVILDRAGDPVELGVALVEGVLTDLPSVAGEYVMPLPPEAEATAFKHAVINWVPAGHPPPMVYTVPHFDVHFYMITDDARRANTLGTPELDAKMARRPEEPFIPAGYAAGMASAQMGMHWNDPTAPERLGQPFTKTFLYGSYDGAIIFAEPMATRAYLETRPAITDIPLKLPTQYGTPGYHPTTYGVGYDPAARDYRISLRGLVKR
ncbi:MAG: DUF5602 domain-containing protein [Gemmatimonadota bacterium]